MRRGLTDIFYRYRHWKAGDVLSNNAYERVPDRRHHFARMHRALLQKELLKKLPTDILHAGKEVTEVQVSEDNATVFFKDKTSTTVDLVIGADGIRSVCDIFSCLCPQNGEVDFNLSKFERLLFPSINLWAGGMQCFEQRSRMSWSKTLRVWTRNRLGG